MKKKIFVALSTFAQYGEEPLKLLKDSGLFFEVSSLGRRILKEEIKNLCKDYHGIVAGVEPYDKEVLDALPNLKCISRCGVGTSNIDLKYAKEKGIKICNTPKVVVQPVAEITVAMIFDLLRKLTEHTKILNSKKWEKRPGNLLAGKNVGILGLGNIGKKVAEMLIALEANVFASDPKLDLDWTRRSGVRMLKPNELLKKSDIVCLHMVVSKEHPFKLGEKEIAMMKIGAYVVNTARGELVDEDALYDALKSGHIAGAALDVFPKEPYSGKLCDLDNVILTPHVATLTEESRLQMEIEAVQNLINILK